MVDDNVFTYAVVSSGAPITLDAGKVYNISKVQYVPNQGNDGVDSMPATGWKAEVSVDGKTLDRRRLWQPQRRSNGSPGPDPQVWC